MREDHDRLKSDQLFRRLLGRKVSGLRAFKDSINKRGGPAIHVGVIWAIPDQSTLPCPYWPRQYRPKTMVHRGFNEPRSVSVRERAWLNDERQRAALLHR